MNTRTVRLRPGSDEKNLLRPGEQIIHKSVDARKKGDIRIVYTLGIREKAVLEPERCQPALRPVVVGFGPAGMFAGLYLARAGARPLILERGSDVDTRKAAVELFRSGGAFSCANNAQFGEGGAGTFSDGKLNTSTHDKRISLVLQIFYEHGADESVLYDSKPHIGTDVLVKIVKSIREEIISLGGEVLFDTKFESLVLENGAVRGVVANGRTTECSDVILATGHSARDTFESLYLQGVPMERKAFSLGARIEHLREDINRAQYGDACVRLPAADYKLSYNGVYTFCMCPGGYVFAANSEENSVCTNGMSYSGRAGDNSNSAVLVTVTPDQFPGEGPLAGMYWQREIEQKAFIPGSPYSATCQLVGDFMAGRHSTGCGRIVPSYRPSVVYGSISDILPDEITSRIKDALPEFDKKLHGFMDADAVLTAPETRSSSPVRILRDGGCMSPVTGLYPCGEGAGYAGGITSSAVDGLRCAESLLSRYGTVRSEAKHNPGQLK